MYPNQQVDNKSEYTPIIPWGTWLNVSQVWLFSVDIVNEHMTHTFSVRTDITWAKFSKDVCQYFDRPCHKVILGYRVSGNRRKFLMLMCEVDWTGALHQVKQKIRSAHKIAVTVCYCWMCYGLVLC